MNPAKSRTALVTGAASGIGLACARELAERGWRVFGTTRGAEPEPGDLFQWLPMDVDRDDSVAEGVATVLPQRWFERAMSAYFKL